MKPKSSHRFEDFTRFYKILIVCQILRQQDYYWPKAMDEYAPSSAYELILTFHVAVSFVCPCLSWAVHVSVGLDAKLEERQIDIVLYECATVR